MDHRKVGSSAQSEAWHFNKAAEEHRLPRWDQVKTCQDEGKRLKRGVRHYCYGLSICGPPQIPMLKP